MQKLSYITNILCYLYHEFSDKVITYEIFSDEIIKDLIFGINFELKLLVDIKYKNPTPVFHPYVIRSSGVVGTC